jgi:hypothetical protein
MNKIARYYVVAYMIALIILLGGCAPIQATYYKPLTEDGYYKGPCGGPDNFGATKLNEELAYFVYVATDGKDSVSATKIGIDLRVYPASIVTLATGTVVVNGSNYHIEVPIGRIHKREWKAEQKKLVQTEYSFPDQLTGYPETNVPAWTFGLSEIQKWGGFSFEVTIPPYAGDELSVTLPGMKLNGEVVNSPVLKVIKVTEHYWQFLCI